MLRFSRPVQLVVDRLECMSLRQLRPVPEHLVVKIAPDQLVEPGLRTLMAGIRGQPYQLADRQRAEPQVRRQP